MPETRRGRKLNLTKPDSTEEQPQEGGGLAEFQAKKEEGGKRPTFRRPGHAPGVSGASRANSSRGWARARQLAQQHSRFADAYKPTEEESVISFLEPDPYDSTERHWVDTDSGKRVYICPKPDRDCLLCERGDAPTLATHFNVVHFEPPKEPEVKTWNIGSKKLLRTLEMFSTDSKYAPLDRTDIYWSVRKTGSNFATDYQLMPIRERDLEEDWGIVPLTDDQWESLREKCLDATSNKRATDSDLQEAAQYTLSDS